MMRAKKLARSKGFMNGIGEHRLFKTCRECFQHGVILEAFSEE